MAQEQDSNQTPSTVRDFIASEMTRRGVDFRECVEQLHLDLAKEAQQERQAWEESPTLPPEGDPSYRPAVHGARSREHLRELVEQGFKSGAGQKCTPALLEEIKAAGRQRVGLGE